MKDSLALHHISFTGYLPVLLRELLRLNKNQRVEKLLYKKPPFGRLPSVMATKRRVCRLVTTAEEFPLVDLIDMNPKSKIESPISLHMNTLCNFNPHSAG